MSCRVPWYYLCSTISITLTPNQAFVVHSRTVLLVKGCDVTTKPQWTDMWHIRSAAE